MITGVINLECVSNPDLLWRLLHAMDTEIDGMRTAVNELIADNGAMVSAVTSNTSAYSMLGSALDSNMIEVSNVGKSALDPDDWSGLSNVSCKFPDTSVAAPAFAATAITSGVERINQPTQTDQKFINLENTSNPDLLVDLLRALYTEIESLRVIVNELAEDQSDFVSVIDGNVSSFSTMGSAIQSNCSCMSDLGKNDQAANDWSGLSKLVCTFKSTLTYAPSQLTQSSVTVPFVSCGINMGLSVAYSAANLINFETAANPDMLVDALNGMHFELSGLRKVVHELVTDHGTFTSAINSNTSALSLVGTAAISNMLAISAVGTELGAEEYSGLSDVIATHASDFVTAPGVLTANSTVIEHNKVGV